MTAGRGFAAYPLITEVLLLTGPGKLFPVKLGKQRGARRQLRRAVPLASPGRSVNRKTFENIRALTDELRYRMVR